MSDMLEKYRELHARLARGDLLPSLGQATGAMSALVVELKDAQRLVEAASQGASDFVDAIEGGDEEAPGWARPGYPDEKSFDTFDDWQEAVAKWDNSPVGRRWHQQSDRAMESATKAQEILDVSLDLEIHEAISELKRASKIVAKLTKSLPMIEEAYKP